MLRSGLAVYPQCPQLKIDVGPEQIRDLLLAETGQTPLESPAQCGLQAWGLLRLRRAIRAKEDSLPFASTDVRAGGSSGFTSPDRH